VTSICKLVRSGRDAAPAAWLVGGRGIPGEELRHRSSPSAPPRPWMSLPARVRRR